MLSELPQSYYKAVRAQDQDGDPRAQRLTKTEREARVYSKDVLTKYNRLPFSRRQGGVGNAIERGYVRSNAVFRKRPVVLQVGGRNVRLQLDPNSKVHPADQLGAQIEQSGLFSSPQQKNGYVSLHLKEQGDQPRRPLSDLSWRDAFKSLTDDATGPYNKARHISVSVNPSLPKRAPLAEPKLIGDDENAAGAPEKEDDVPKVTLEEDGMASRDDILRIIMYMLARKAAKHVISQHDERKPDWRPTLQHMQANPVVVRRIVLRAVHKAKPVAFPHASPRAAFRKLGCHDPCAGINTFSTLLTNCLASSECAPPPTICNPRLFRCYNPCKLKRYLADKMCCFLRNPLFAWATSCARSLRARAKRFLSCYKDCRENCCALRPAERCPDGAVNQDECVQVDTICDSSSSDSDSSSSDSDDDTPHGLSSMEAMQVRHLRKHRRGLRKAERGVLRKFCRSCHQRRAACACKRGRARSLFCSFKPPVSPFDGLCPVAVSPYGHPCVPICEPIGAKFDPNDWKKAATGIPTMPSTPEGTYSVETPAAPAAQAPLSEGQGNLQPTVLDFGFMEDEGEGEGVELDPDIWNDGEEDDGEDDDPMDIGGKYADKFRKYATKVKDTAYGKSKAYHVRMVLIDADNQRGVVENVFTRYLSNTNRMYVLEAGKLSKLRAIATDNKLTIPQKAAASDKILEAAKRVKNQAEADKVLRRMGVRVNERIGDEFDEEEEGEEDGDDEDYDYGPNFMWDDYFVQKVREKKRKQEEEGSAASSSGKRQQRLAPGAGVVEFGEEDYDAAPQAGRGKKRRDGDMDQGSRKRTREQIGDLMSDRFELNAAEHARYATAESDAEIQAALKSALARTGTPDDHLLFQAVVDTNRAHTKHVARRIAAQFTSDELADEGHIGWAMGQYWAAQLNRRRILAWNRFAHWYNRRTCSRKLCVLPVPPCPAKPDPCKPGCKKRDDPCKSDPDSDSEKADEDALWDDGVAASSSTRSSEEEEEEPENTDDDDEEEEEEASAIRARIEAAKVRALMEEEEPLRVLRRELSKALRDKDDDKEAELREKIKNYIKRRKPTAEDAELGKLRAKLSEAITNRDDEAEHNARTAIAAFYAKRREAKMQGGAVSSAEPTKIAAPVSSPALPSYKFKVANFVRKMQETGADSAFRNFSKPDVDAHLIMLHDEHPSQARVLAALERAQGDTALQRKILAPMTVFVPRNADGSMQSMNNVKVLARDGKTQYEFSRGGEQINGKEVGPPVDLRTGSRPLSYGDAVKLVYPVSDFSH